MDRTLLRRCAALAVAASAAACFDEIPDPNRGFVQVFADDVPGVEVLVDGASQGAAGLVGPFDAGTYRISVRRAGYEIVPAEREVEVLGGRTARAEFALTLAFTGGVMVGAVDEVRGGAVAGGEVFVDRGAGSFEPTGVASPGVVAGLAPGPVRFVVRRSGFQASDPVGADVVVADTTEVTAVLGPPRAVVIDMFTWVVCPNCPPAAVKLHSLNAAAPDRVFVIEWHVRPALPLYHPGAPARAVYYGADPRVGPAAVFQGGVGDTPAVLLGSQAADLAEYEARTVRHLSSCGNDCSVALVVDGSITSAGAEATVRALWRGGTLPGSLILRAVLIENDVQAPGNQPYFSFVARDLKEAAITWAAPGEVLTRGVSLPVNPAWDVDQLRLVVFVQSDETREILAAGGI